MTALIVVLSLRAFLETGSDDVSLGGASEDDASVRPEEPRR
jgi:hypothetical protein